MMCAVYDCGLDTQRLFPFEYCRREGTKQIVHAAKARSRDLNLALTNAKSSLWMLQTFEKMFSFCVESMPAHVNSILCRGSSQSACCMVSGRRSGPISQFSARRNVSGCCHLLLGRALLSSRKGWVAIPSSHILVSHCNRSFQSPHVPHCT